MVVLACASRGDAATAAIGIRYIKVRTSKKACGKAGDNIAGVTHAKLGGATST